MEKLTDYSKLDREGIHKGKKLIDVPAEYLFFLYDRKFKIDSNLKDYIIDNLDVLKKEINEKAKY